MELTTRPTLAQTIAAGRRLLATAPGVERAGSAPPHLPTVDVPRQATAAADGDGDWRSPDDIARLARCDPWTVAEHLRNGTLHGHVDSGRWRVRARVAEAFLAGRDLVGQRRTCGCGARLRLVHGCAPDASATDETSSSAVPRPARRVAAALAPARPAMSGVAPTLET